MSGRRCRLGMVGGAGRAFIGPVHAMAARLDGHFEIVAGAFSSDPERSRDAAGSYGVVPDRAYPSYAAMFAAEAERSDGIEAVSIVTPNHLHHPVAMAALAAGLHVMCDKPLAITIDQARELAAAAERAKRQLHVTYTYSGYPMVREARARIARGELGAIRKVVVVYSQGWLSRAIEGAGQKQADWRTDPTRAGQGGCIGDIGVHAFHLAEFVTGLRVQNLCADLGALVEGRLLDDDCNMLLRFYGGARGVLIASQIAIGDDNSLSIRVYGAEGAIFWAQESPCDLIVASSDGEKRVLRAGGQTLSAEAMRASRLPAGHPEGYIEAFANIYNDFHCAVSELSTGAQPGYSSGAEAVRGIEFIDAAVRSGGIETEFGRWIPL